MHWEQKVQYATNTDVGMRRKNNQDSLVVQTLAEQEAWEQKGHLFLGPRRSEFVRRGRRNGWSRGR